MCTHTNLEAISILRKKLSFLLTASDDVPSTQRFEAKVRPEKSILVLSATNLLFVSLLKAAQR